MLSQTDAAPSQVREAVQLNEQQRLRALKLGLLILASISAIAIVPASRLPRYRPHEIPDPAPAQEPLAEWERGRGRIRTCVRSVAVPEARRRVRRHRRVSAPRRAEASSASAASPSVPGQRLAEGAGGGPEGAIGAGELGAGSPGADDDQVLGSSSRVSRLVTVREPARRRGGGAAARGDGHRPASRVASTSQAGSSGILPRRPRISTVASSRRPAAPSITRTPASRRRRCRHPRTARSRAARRERSPPRGPRVGRPRGGAVHQPGRCPSSWEKSLAWSSPSAVAIRSLRAPVIAAGPASPPSSISTVSAPCPGGGQRGLAVAARRRRR